MATNTTKHIEDEIKLQQKQFMEQLHRPSISIGLGGFEHMFDDLLDEGPPKNASALTPAFDQTKSPAYFTADELIEIVSGRRLICGDPGLGGKPEPFLVVFSRVNARGARPEIRAAIDKKNEAAPPNEKILPAITLSCNIVEVARFKLAIDSYFSKGISDMSVPQSTTEQFVQESIQNLQECSVLIDDYFSSMEKLSSEDREKVILEAQKQMAAQASPGTCCAIL